MAMKAIRGRISPGAFSGEKVFKIEEIGHQGVVPVIYCWDDLGNPLKPEEPQEEIQGLVACRVLKKKGKKGFLVAIPDGNVVTVPFSIVVARPAGAPAHVPV